MDVSLDSIRDIQLYQPKTGYRFSVDSLLLYHFVHLRHVSNIADLGAGSGIIGILLAKKYPKAKVTLIDIQQSLVELAKRNVTLNKVSERVHVCLYDLRTLPEEFSKQFDLIVSNPPFRRVWTGKVNSSPERAIARHEITVNLTELIRTASRILRMKGRFCMIYHPWRLSELFQKLHENDFEPKRACFIHSNELSEAKMVLLEAVKGGRGGLKTEPPFFIYKAGGTYSDEMRMIYNGETDQ